MSHITYIEEKNGRMPLHFLDAAYINGYFWVSALEWNGYYKVNLETGKAEFLGTFENADLMADKLFHQVLAYKEFVFFIPWFSNYLVKLNIQNLETIYYKLPDSMFVEMAKFRVAAIYEKKIFMFPHLSDNICIFDIEKEAFSCDKEWSKEFLKSESFNVKDRFVRGCRINEQIYLANFSGNFIMKYNLNNYQYETIIFPEDEKKIVDIVAFSDDKLIILTWTGNVRSYDIRTGSINLIYKYRGKVEFPYRHVVLYQDRILLIPAFEKNIVSVDKEKENILSYPDEWEMQYINVGIESIFNRYYKKGNRIILYPCLGNMILKIDVSKNMITGVKVVGGNNINLHSLFNLVDNENSIYRNSSNIKGTRIWNEVSKIEN